MIGRSEGTGRRAADEKAHKAGLSDDRLNQLRDEAFVSWMARQAVKPHQPPDEVVSDLDGSTPWSGSRTWPARPCRHSPRSMGRLASAESNPEDALDILERPCRRIERTMKAVALDHAMWEAMAGGWSAGDRRSGEGRCAHHESAARDATAPIHVAACTRGRFCRRCPFPGVPRQGATGIRDCARHSNVTMRAARYRRLTEVVPSATAYVVPAARAPQSDLQRNLTAM